MLEVFSAADLGRIALVRALSVLALYVRYFHEILIESPCCVVEHVNVGNSVRVEFLYCARP